MADPSTPPRPAAFAPSFGPIPQADLVSLIRADLRLRWRRGERVAAEAYVERLPFLRNDRAALLDLVVAEAELRDEAGERVVADEYRRRFPDLAGPLIWRLALHRSSAGSLLPTGRDVSTIPAPARESESPAPQPAAVPEPTAAIVVEPEEPLPEQSAPEPPAPVGAPDRQSTGFRGAWDWCRRHPVPATVLPAAAVCLLLGTVAGQFAGRANSTAPPVGDVTDDSRHLVRQARERAERAEQDAAAANARADAAAAARDEAVRAKEAGRRPADGGHPDDKLFTDLFQGDDLAPGRFGDRLLAAAKSHYEHIVQDGPDDPARSKERGQALVRIALISEAAGQSAGAIGRLRQAVDVLSAHGKAAPATDRSSELALATYHLGRLQRQAGNLAEAETAGRRAVQIDEAIDAERSNAAARHQLARSLLGLADTLAAAERFDDAIGTYRRAIDTWKSFAEGDLSARDRLAVTWERFGDCLSAAGQSADPETRRRAVDVLRQAAREKSADPRVTDALARNLGRLGDALRDREPALAAECYESAAATWPRLENGRPQAAEDLERQAGVLDGLAQVQQQLGHADAADNAAGRALDVRERIVNDHPGEPKYVLALAEAHSARGARLRDGNRDEDAATEFRRATPLLEDLAGQAPQDSVYRVRLAVNEMCLAQLDLRGRRTEPARAGYKRAIARLDGLDAHSPDVAVNRGVCCINLGQLAAQDGKALEAHDWYGRAERLLKPLSDEPRWKEFVAGALADCARGRDEVNAKRR